MYFAIMDVMIAVLLEELVDEECVDGEYPLIVGMVVVAQNQSSRGGGNGALASSACLS
jgi:hypothetical protein